MYISVDTIFRNLFLWLKDLINKLKVIDIFQHTKLFSSVGYCCWSILKKLTFEIVTIDGRHDKCMETKSTPNLIFCTCLNSTRVLSGQPWRQTRTICTAHSFIHFGSRLYCVNIINFGSRLYGVKF